MDFLPFSIHDHSIDFAAGDAREDQLAEEELNEEPAQKGGGLVAWTLISWSNIWLVVVNCG